jgi:hypothetical protein
MTDGSGPVTLADLDARLREVEALQELVLRLLSTLKPLDRVLEQYGATETQTRAFYTLLDDFCARTTRGQQDRPSFSYFEMQMGDLFPALRGNREFLSLLIDTMKVDRPAYRELHAYISAHGWPVTS